MTKWNKKELAGELLFFFLLMCYYVMWAKVQPMNAAPDEHMRYQIAEFIYQYGALPVADDPRVIDPSWGISYAFNPILDYMIAALFMKVMSLISTKPFALLMAARMVSVLCGVGTAFMTLRIGKKLFDPAKAWLMTVFVATMPGMVFVTSYVNCDALAIFSSGIIVYFWICGWEKDWDLKSCIGLALGISVCALSYYNTYGFILCSIIFFGSTMLLWCGKNKNYKSLLTKGGIISAIVLILIAWWFIRNCILYGDLLGRNAARACAEKHAIDSLKPSNLMTPSDEGMSLWEMLVGTYGATTISWIELVSRSFVGRFGALSVAMPAWVENNLMDFIKAGFLLVFLHPVRMFALRENKTWRKEGIFNWCMMICLILPNFLNAWYSYATDYQPQGRYSLPMLIPLTYFMVKGYGFVFDDIIQSEKIRRNVYAVACALLTALSVYVYITVFWDTYMNGVPFSIGAFLAGAS
ncbi:MAG: glycosyltransferase family 39 protein [Blautia sp.]|nr:glycosyltransferase family 39 protein [Blautia sp.]